eukprot:gene4092-2939_t
MTEGRGFVHLNTPAEIHYTEGHTVSLGAVAARKSRVEAVQLPSWMATWRRGRKAFVAHDGYASFATDAENERSGDGPVLPELAAAVASQRDRFYVGGDAAATKRGVTIVTHHKVSGACTFTYPDYDGVLLNGTVPEVVLSVEEREAEVARRALYVSPLEMTEEEAAALEELQALWKSRSLSRSSDGGQMRAALRAADAAMDLPSKKRQRLEETQTGSAEEKSAVEELDELLLMANELLGDATPTGCLVPAPVACNPFSQLNPIKLEFLLLFLFLSLSFFLVFLQKSKQSLYRKEESTVLYCINNTQESIYIYIYIFFLYL